MVEFLKVIVKGSNMSIAGSLAKIAKAAAKNGGNAVKIIEAAGAVVAAANILMEQAKPLMEDVDVKAVTDSIKAGAGSVAKNAGDTAGKVGALFGKLGDAKNELVEGLAQAKGEKELKRAIQDARQSVLENATTTITVADFLKAKEKTGEGVIGPINTMPGCFIIATYKKLDFDKDLTDYIGLYIGRSDNVSEGVQTAISRKGDPDVYADVKYKQNVYVYVFNCMPEELDDLHVSLTRTFADMNVGNGKSEEKKEGLSA